MTQVQTPDETTAALTIEVVTLFPEVMAGFLVGHCDRPGHRGRGPGGSLHEPARLCPGPSPPGGRHALRRWAGDDPQRRADCRRAGGDRHRAWPVTPHPAHAPRGSVRPGACPGAGGRDAPDPHLRALRRDRRTGRRRWSTRSCGLATSSWRAARWRRRRSSRPSRAWSPASSAALSPPARSHSRPGGSNTPSGPVPRPGTGRRFPRCCSPATTGRSPAGGTARPCR